MEKPKNNVIVNTMTAINKEGSQPISRVLSRAIIHLGNMSPCTSSNLPGDSADHALCPPIWSCSEWGFPCHNCYQLRGALLPHHFTLTNRSWRYIFCGTFRRLTPPRRYLALCPVEPGLSSPDSQRLSGAIAWPTPGDDFTLIVIAQNE